jgi:fused signal recognition particle receptor
MGLFSKIFSALKKTKDGLSEKLRMLFAKDKIGEEFYEDLEDILISSDISVSTADEIVENLRDRMIDEKVKDIDYVISQLKAG